MEQQNKHSTQPDMMRLIIVLICILVFLLAVVVVITVATRRQPSVDATEPSATVTESTESTEETPGQTEYIGMTIQCNTENNTVTLNNTIVFEGTSDPAQPVTVNGTQVTRKADGSFVFTAQLNSGKNEFVFTHKEETVTHIVEYRYAVERFSHAEATQWGSGATIPITVSVREGSELQVTLNGKTIEMKKSIDPLISGAAEGFVVYEGKYALPNTNTSDLDLGPITYTVTCNGITETYTSGNVTCKKSTQVLASNPAVTPDYGNYIDVGSGYIVEIISKYAETFNGKTIDDHSNPTHNYLPEGTVDYCSTKIIKDASGQMSYRLLRCGRRVYTEAKNSPYITKLPVVNCYTGTLPDHNEIRYAGLTQNGHFTEVSLDVLWKAPFYFDMAPQRYYNPSIRDWRVSALTAEYVDITFCYATSFEGMIDIPGNNPLFSRAQLTQNKSDCVLRLYLKEKGKFYGWDAYYNEADQLCFKFLNPTPVTAAENDCGADLTGVRIMLDVGHGGFDPGAVGKDTNGREVTEASRNLALALELKAQLESAGATVIMNRETDVRLTTNERNTFLKEQAPDLCICIHHNSVAGAPNINGCEVYYFAAHSQRAAELIQQETEKSGVYKSTTLGWHVYFVGRMSNCPVVLLECGYMTNADDLAASLDPAKIQLKAQAITKGVAKYFLEQNQ